MTTEEITELNERNIRKALEDYGRHTRKNEVLENVSDEFIKQVAEKNAHSKAALRALFRRSPVWNEELQALVISGNCTHDTDYRIVEKLGRKLLSPARSNKAVTLYDIEDIIMFFCEPNAEERVRNMRIETIKRVAPAAYAPGKKPSRIFKAICKALGIADERSGSDFQKLYARFADELSSRRINFKLFVSINPAHFLTMSNPKRDKRGSTLISCHSFNTIEQPYTAGSSGYACDDVSIIAFTAADPDDPESLNNRKTTRQIFAYKPGNGVLLQSRLYNTSGGTTGAQETSRVYRDLIQRELSALENVPNLWKTGASYKNHAEHIIKGEGFGGYADWEYASYDGKISIRADHADKHGPIVVGTYGYCVCCGEKTASGLTCDKCNIDEYCEDCGDTSDELFEVYDHEYEVRRVCDFCRGEYYTHCVECDSYHPDDMVTEIYDGNFVCKHCLERYYVKCDHCESYYPSYKVHVTEDKNGNAVHMCFYCEEKLSSDAEKPKAEDENITPLEKAKQLINEFCEAEYLAQADFSDLHNIGLAYTTLTDQEFPVQVTADLIEFEIRTLVLPLLMMS